MCVTPSTDKNAIWIAGGRRQAKATSPNKYSGMNTNLNPWQMLLMNAANKAPATDNNNDAE